jgi:hypothetical protein
MYFLPKFAPTSRSRHSTEQCAQFESKVTTLTSRITRSLEKRKGGGGRGRGGGGGGKGSGTFPTY